MNTPIIERARRYIAKMPPGIEGQNGSAATFKVACTLARGFDLDREAAMSLLEEWSNQYCVPPWEDHELRHKLRDAMASNLPLGYLLDDPPLGDSTDSATPKEPAWPPIDYGAICSILDQPALSQVSDIASLRAASPQATDSLTANSVLPKLFPGDPLITAGYAPGDCHTTLLSKILPKADTMQFIVPSAATKCEGLTQEGKKSHHCLSIVGTRQYLVLENDFKDEGECGNMLLYALVMEGCEPRDVSARLIGYMARILPTLALVVFSGGKSIHAWFNVSKFADDQATLKRFMRVAVSLGFDRAGWTKSQLCRMPGGTRKDRDTQATCPQPIWYFDPSQCLLP